MTDKLIALPPDVARLLADAAPLEEAPAALKAGVLATLQPLLVAPPPATLPTAPAAGAKAAAGAKVSSLLTAKAFLVVASLTVGAGAGFFLRPVLLPQQRALQEESASARAEVQGRPVAEESAARENQANGAGDLSAARPSSEVNAGSGAGEEANAAHEPSARPVAGGEVKVALARRDAEVTPAREAKPVGEVKAALARRDAEATPARKAKGGGAVARTSGEEGRRAGPVVSAVGEMNGVESSAAAPAAEAAIRTGAQASRVATGGAEGSAAPARQTGGSPLSTASENDRPVSAARTRRSAEEHLMLETVRTALLKRQGADALSLLGLHELRYPTSDLREEREALRVRALVLDHRPDEAQETLARFRAAFPGSILLPGLEAAVADVP